MTKKMQSITRSQKQAPVLRHKRTSNPPLKYPLFFNTSTKRPFIETKRRNNFFFRRFSFVKRRSISLSFGEG